MKPLERNAPPRLDRAREVARRHLAPAFAFGDRRLARGQPEQIGGAVQPAFLVEFADGLLAEPVDVERRARDEMDQPLDALRLADQAAGAAPHRLAGRAHRVAAAHRADLGVHVRLRILRPPFGYHGNDLRDHVAGALQHDGVADADVLAGDLVLVVQRRVLHQHAADIHRLEPRDRRQRAGAADLDADVLQHGHRLFGGELPGDRPARRAADEAEPALQRQVVELVDHAVDVVAETGTFHRDLRLERGGIGLAVQQARQRVHLEPPFAQTLQIMPVGIGDRLARFALGIGEQRQRPLRGDARIELTQAAGGGVARIGEHLVARRGLRLVHLEEVGLGHEDLAADLDQRRRATLQARRHGLHACGDWR